MNVGDNPPLARPLSPQQVREEGLQGPSGEQYRVVSFADWRVHCYVSSLQLLESRMRKLSLIVLFPLFVQAQTTYHISADSTYKTITDVNGLSLKTGDKVQFKCGETFYGQITVSHDSVTYGSFGSGAKPIVTGAKTLTGWVARGSFYAMKTDAQVLNLYANGVQMTPARTPNAGQFYYPATATSMQLTCANLTGRTGYYNGATLRAHVVTYAYGFWPNVTWDGTRLTYTLTTGYSPVTTRGFYLDNFYAALDTANEWYYDTTTDSLYFWPPGGADPSTMTIEGAVLDHGAMDSAKVYIAVDNLAFKNQVMAGVGILGTVNHIRLTNLSVSQQRSSGIRFAGNSTSCLVDGCTVTDVGNHGITFGNSGAGAWTETAAHITDTISNNTVRRAGMVGGLGMFRNYYGTQGMGISINTGAYGHSNAISKNRVDSVGYTAIQYAGLCGLVEKNYVSHVCLRETDGGAFYSYSQNWTGTIGTVWQYNVAEDVIGNVEGAEDFHVFGMYWDHGSKSVKAQYNTFIRIRGPGACLQMYDTVAYNTFYDCPTSNLPQLGTITLVMNDTATVVNNSIVGNTMWLKTPYASTQAPHLYLQRRIRHANFLHMAFGTCDSNYFCSENNSDVANELYYEGKYKRNLYKFGTWKTWSSQDAHSDTLWKGYCSTVDSSAIFVNYTDASIDTTLRGVWYNLNGSPQAMPLTLAAYRSKILVKDKTANPTTISLTSGDNQTRTATLTLTAPFVVTVIDGTHPVRNVTVAWTVATHPGGATGQALSSSSGFTDAYGQASTILTLGSVAGTYTVTAKVTGLAGSPVTFTATASPVGQHYLIKK